MPFFAAKCPVTDEERVWIEKNLHWLIKAFDLNPLAARTVVLPTPEFFPDPYSGQASQLRPFFERVAGFMEFDSTKVGLELIDDDTDPLRHKLPSFSGWNNRQVGVYQREGEMPAIYLNRAYLKDPISLATVLSREFAHLLICDHLQKPIEERKREQLTDLLTIMLGMGIFLANRILVYEQWHGTGKQGHQVIQIGRLSEQRCGYALGYFAFLRDETKPDWLRYIDSGVRPYIKAALKYLAKTKSAPINADLPGS